MSDSAPGHGRARLDRWLWAARFFKTRALAKAAVEGGHVLVLPDLAGAGPAADRHGTKAKPGREIGIGDRLLIHRGEMAQTVRVLAVAERRGSATAASQLYEEAPESIEARESERARRQLERAGLQAPGARPDKRDRRERMKLKQAAGAGEAAMDPSGAAEDPP